MPNIIQPSAAKTLSLDELNDFSRGNESSGPLKAMRTEGERTVLTFDLEQLPPDQLAVIVAADDGKASVPAGADLVCEGEVFVKSKKTKAIAYRAKS
jgi:hypothetical protein